MARAALLVVTLGLGSILAVRPAYAHHSFAAEYDANKPVTMTGSVTKIEWVNPHAWIYIDVADGEGKIRNWAFQLGAPLALSRMGWKKAEVLVGAKVTITGYLARDGSHACARSVTMPDGSTLSAFVDVPGQGSRSREASSTTGSPSIVFVSTLAPASAFGRSQTPEPAPASGQSPASQSAAAKPIPKDLPAILARVNDEVVERWEFQGAVRDFDAQSGHDLPPEWREQALHAVLDDIVAEHLLAQEAQVQHLQVSETEVDMHLALLRKDFPDEQSFENSLVPAGLSLADLHQQIARHLLREKVIEAEVDPLIKVEETDVQAYYQENIERFRQIDKSLAEAGAAIRELLAEEQREEKTDELVAHLKARARIEIYV